MNVFGHKRPLYLKTYSRQKRKVEQWFSPELRKKAFSFSSTSSSDPSMAEPTPSKKRKKMIAASVASRTTRVAKKRAMTALKLQESDEENAFVPDTPPRKNSSTKPLKRAAVMRNPSGMDGVPTSKSKRTREQMMRIRMKKKPVVFSSSEDDSFVMKCNVPNPRRATQGKLAGASANPAPVGRFVTHRRRALPIQRDKPTVQTSSGVSSSTPNSSVEFVRAVSFGRGVTRRKQPTIQEFGVENSDRRPQGPRACAALHEISFNDSRERRTSDKRPPLCSTPSLASTRHLRFLEPSVSEISSLSCDEEDAGGRRSARFGKVEVTRPGNTEVTCAERTYRRQKTEVFNEDGAKEAGESKENGKERSEEGQKCRSTGFVSTLTHLDFQGEDLKEQCRSVSSFVLLEKMDIVRNLSKQSNGGMHVDSRSFLLEASRTCRGTRSRDVSADCTNLQPRCLTSPPSTSYNSAPPARELEILAQSLVDRLKVECLSSCVTVSLRSLDTNALHQAQKGSGGFRTTRVSSPPHPTEADCAGVAQRGPVTSGNPPELNPRTDESESSSWERAGGLRRRLSASFLCSDPSPKPRPLPGKAHPPPAAHRERNGAGTGRKACVSGLSATRWSKRGTAAHNGKRRNKTATCSKPEDCSLNYLLPLAAKKHTGEPLYGWMQGTSGIGLPATPLRAEQLNLSSLLANFTPDTLTTHSWGRLKAALSVHKKMMAFPTPQRLAMSKMQSPGAMETSLELFGTPLSKPASSRLPQVTLTNTPLALYDEDISDAEKVYQECQQDGPISFHDCIPPERMKRCTKIGEGTFGEVFSTVDDSSQTVALKIIPVEGCQKVNGEPQKTFGEILHEIIISKELSSLNSKEENKSNGFIGLNNLHCVRGSYPSALLRAWDKYDQGKGSENDRPDFFSEEQLFLILEFEFGGSDLENMNGKLSSLIQAKSVLHQVTVALAVAEQALCFEHRDLHWGNILVKSTKQKSNEFILNGSVHSIDTRGVHVNIIDYSLSRLEIDELTVSCDIANDEELFLGQGDYQFEIYRLMRKENNNCWSEYNPHSNVLWLHYLVDKLLAMRYKTKTHSSHQKAVKSDLQAFRSEILGYSSATDALLHCSLFQ